MCKLRYYFLSLFILFVSNNALADCAWGGKPFLKIVEEVDLIVRGQILAYPSSSSLEMEVLEIYKGTTDALKIQIFPDSFFYFRLESFSIGSEWIFAVKRMEGDGVSDKQYILPSDYCEDSYFLKVEDSVVGNFTNTEKYIQQRVSLDEFRDMLLIFIPNAQASCSGGTVFLKLLEQVDLIVRGKILASYPKESHLPYSVDMEVLEIYKGTTEALKINILALTNYIAANALIGTEGIFAVDRMDGDGMSDQYIIPIKGSQSYRNKFYLKVEASVVGNLSNTENYYNAQRVSLNEFRNMLQYIDSKPSLTDNERVQVGRQQCIDDPASCGISNDDCPQEASYDPTTGKLHIPCLKVPSASGGMTTYEVNFSQRIPSFVFDLDLNSLKVH